MLYFSVPHQGALSGLPACCSSSFQDNHAEQPEPNPLFNILTSTLLGDLYKTESTFNDFVFSSSLMNGGCRHRAAQRRPFEQQRAFTADTVAPVRIQIMISEAIWASEMWECQREHRYRGLSLWVALNANTRILNFIQTCTRSQWCQAGTPNRAQTQRKINSRRQLYL